MTRNLFREYIRWFNQQMTGRKTLLLLNSFFSYHAGLDLFKTQSIKLPNVRVEFLPANTTFIC
jgi:DDE superfamily endonuclease